MGKKTTGSDRIARWRIVAVATSLALPAAMSATPGYAMAMFSPNGLAVTVDCRLNGVPVTGPTIEGTNDDDVFTCDVFGPGAYFLGGAGNDRIEMNHNRYGIISGNEGADIVKVKINSGLIQSGGGADTIEVDTMAVNQGDVSIRGGDGNDQITVRDNSGQIQGNAGDDTITVPFNNGTVDGNEGSDTCRVAGETGTTFNCEAQ
ncbi:hypothetical protein FGW37_28735 [Streptomyces rectiverticillatus]|uniref:hypothetical protein n=1 Tax=Streptomyces rectiverticillatus TaxID=173860 RepID=UPI0015C3C1D7|nr:hypothetical protein [Streptomyces rectiverticillatus]QLE75057.1 hypothetical protein FGW37_28735 [Streptomyces rectiverticillatus]